MSLYNKAFVNDKEYHCDSKQVCLSPYKTSCNRDVVMNDGEIHFSAAMKEMVYNVYTRDLYYKYLISSLLDQFISYKENEVLWTCTQVSISPTFYEQQLLCQNPFAKKLQTQIVST